jgi:hypothetical protein
MSLFNLLETMGGKLGILEISHNQTAHCAGKIQTRAVTLAELSTEIQAEEVRALADQPAELSLPFEKIFETAGITPGTQSWTVEKLKEVLRSESFKDQPKELAQKKILETLHAEKVSPEEIVKDAMARDKVLDSFEVYVRKKMEQRRAALERRAAELEEGLKRLEAERAELEQKRKSDEERWVQWKQQKKAHEQDMAWAIGHLIDKPVISMSDE